MSNYSKTIDRYKMGEMIDPIEKQRFENEINTNMQLAREKRFDDDIDKMLSDEDMLDFRKQLTEVYHEESAVLNRPFIMPVYRKRWYMAAASIFLILMVSGALYFLIPQKYNNEKLFSMYYSPEQVMNISRSGNDQLFNALLKYQKKDFAEASVLFDELLENNTSNFAIRFYNGIASIETHQYRKAINSFQYIIGHNDNLFVEHATWFLGLTYLKEGLNNDAIMIFKKIAADTHNYYRRQAEEILAKIRGDDS